MITGIGTGFIHHRTIQFQFRMDSHQAGACAYLKFFYLKPQFFKQVPSYTIFISGKWIIGTGSSKPVRVLFNCQMGVEILISIEIALEQNCLFYPIFIHYLYKMFRRHLIPAKLLRYHPYGLTIGIDSHSVSYAAQLSTCARSGNILDQMSMTVNDPALSHPFTPPAAIPSTKESCAVKNTISEGTIAISDMANTLFHSNPTSASMDIRRKMDTGYLATVLT